MTLNLDYDFAGILDNAYLGSNGLPMGLVYVEGVLYISIPDVGSQHIGKPVYGFWSDTGRNQLLTLEPPGYRDRIHPYHSAGQRDCSPGVY